MEYGKDEFISNIILKNMLINTPINIIQEVNNNGLRIDFLKSIINLLNIEDGFILMDPKFLIKIEEFIYTDRFKYKTNNENSELVNNIIYKINNLKSKTELQINIIKYNYLCYQEECRKLSFVYEEQFFNSIAYDAVIYENFTKLLPINIENDYFFLGTTNYFINVMPELYKNPLFLKQTIDIIDSRYKKTIFGNKKLKKFAKETKKSLQTQII